MMNNLLIDEPPLQVLPSLVIELGNTDKAIIMQQMHYWLQRSNNVVDGHRWIYNSAHDWQKQFPWLTEKTIQRYLKSLVDDGWLISGNYNKAKFDRTKWYRIRYDRLDKNVQALGLAVPTIGPDSTNGMGLSVPTNTNRLPETTTETNYSTSISDKPGIDYVGIVNYLNESAGKNYRSTTPKTRTLIRARFKEGFNSDDFKEVIDNKVAVWKGDQKMNRYLRPETLFGTKFESYLNDEPQQPVRDDSYTYF